MVGVGGGVSVMSGRILNSVLFRTATKL